MFQEKLKQKLYGIDSEHQTNKHSKILLNKHKSVLGQGLIEEGSTSRDLHASVPSRASSASPSSMIRTKTSSPDVLDEADENTIRPTTVLPHTLQIESAYRPNVTNSSTQIHSVRSPHEETEEKHTTIPHSAPSGQPGQAGSSKDAHIDSLSLYTDHSGVDQLSSESAPTTSITDTATAKQRFFEGHFSDSGGLKTKSESQSASERSHPNTSTPLMAKQLPETKVEFFYSLTGQSPFSPPLSPTLHPPCASLPTAVTLPSFYEYPSSSFKDELQHRMDRLRINAQNTQ
ncbi:unnamed protein product [Echinostoma caproni]|uniref:TBD domain-containing protein n=1 Tax=Echinostoma caproni TaxID=27848 RepID=A0A183ABD2_9TREM|nr:unnamed protein product [Echinostoma caproni]